MTPTWWAVAFVGIILRSVLFQEILKHPVPDTVNICQAKKKINKRKQIQTSWDAQTSNLVSSTEKNFTASILPSQASVNQDSLQLLWNCSCPPWSLLTQTLDSCSFRLMGAQGIYDLCRHDDSHRWSLKLLTWSCVVQPQENLPSLLSTSLT